MIDLSAYDPSFLTTSMRRIRFAAAFAERQELIEAEASTTALTFLPSASASPAALAPSTSMAAAPASSPAPVSQGGRPFTGFAPVSPPEWSLAEDEWALQSPTAAGGGGRGSSPPAPSASPSARASGLGGGVPRSPEAKKAALAAGSQAAVVKLASYGAGPVRAASLMNYQSDEGELPLEREDGSLVTGKAAVAELAAEWREENVREPSKDVFRLDVAFDGRVSEDEARTALADALKGHRFAWRIEERQSSTTVRLVAVAASSRHDENDKRERIYPNAKSLDRLYDKIELAFGREADFSKPTWAHATEGATTQLAALTKAGQLHAETNTGASIAAEADQLFARLPSNANRDKPDNFNPNLQLAKAWRPSMRSSAPRDFAHVILSAKPGTDKEAFMDAARATLAKEFAGHEYVFVMHTNRRHIHVHAAIRLTSPTGEKLHPGIQDFNRWRATLAEQARERNVPMEAVRRSTRRTRPPTSSKTSKWSKGASRPKACGGGLSASRTMRFTAPPGPKGANGRPRPPRNGDRSPQGAAFPAPLAAGAMRLYRAEAATEGTHRGTLFVNDRALAETYLAQSDGAQLLYIDVPTDRLSELRPSRNNPAQMYVVPASLRSLVKAVDQSSEAAILPFQRRAEAALTPRPQDQTKPHFQETKMRTAETMDAARTQLGKSSNAFAQFFQKATSEKSSTATPATSSKTRGWRPRRKRAWNERPARSRATGSSNPNQRPTFRRSSRMGARAWRSITAATTPRPAPIKPSLSSTRGRRSTFATGATARASTPPCSSRRRNGTASASTAATPTKRPSPSLPPSMATRSQILRYRIASERFGRRTRRNVKPGARLSTSRKRTSPNLTIPPAPPRRATRPNNLSLPAAPSSIRPRRNAASSSTAFGIASKRRLTAKRAKRTAQPLPMKRTPPAAARRSLIARRKRPASPARPSVWSKIALRGPFHATPINPRRFRRCATNKSASSIKKSVIGNAKLTRKP